MGMIFFKKLLSDKTIIEGKIIPINIPLATQWQNNQEVNKLQNHASNYEIKIQNVIRVRIYCFRMYTLENQIKHWENNVTSKTNPKFYLKINKYEAGHNNNEIRWF